MRNKLQEAIDAYQAVRLANASGLTVAQVETLNSLERYHGEIKIEQTLTGQLWVEYTDEYEIWRNPIVREDGTLNHKPYC